MKTKILVLFFMSMFCISFTYALPIAWKGYVFIGGNDASSGTRVDVYINGKLFKTTYTPTINTAPKNYYTFEIIAKDSDILKFYVRGIPAYTTSYDEADSGKIIHKDLSVNLYQNGESCNYDYSCASGKCCSGFCAETCNSNSNNGGGSRSSSSQTTTTTTIKNNYGTEKNDYQSTTGTNTTTSTTTSTTLKDENKKHKTGKTDEKGMSHVTGAAIKLPKFLKNRKVYLWGGLALLILLILAILLSKIRFNKGKGKKEEQDEKHQKFIEEIKSVNDI